MLHFQLYFDVDTGASCIDSLLTLTVKPAVLIHCLASLFQLLLDKLEKGKAILTLEEKTNIMKVNIEQLLCYTMFKW